MTVVVLEGEVEVDTIVGCYCLVVITVVVCCIGYRVSCWVVYCVVIIVGCCCVVDTTLLVDYKLLYNLLTCATLTSFTLSTVIYPLGENTIIISIRLPYLSLYLIAYRFFNVIGSIC